jgi:gamma-glutamylcyclotransferase
MELYFAYGSNMSSTRLRERIPHARSLGSARAPGWRFAWNKRGRDGTGKANLVVEERAVVWGVLYELRPDDWSVLDRYEPGYARMAHELLDAEGRLHPGQLYVCHAHGPDLALQDWYREHLIEGAREHALPSQYVARLEELPTL